MDEMSRHERFMQLFLPAEQSLYVYLRTLIPNSSDAEDVLQAAAAVMWAKFGEFQMDTRFEHWAYHICRLQALRHLKERKRSRLVLSDDTLALVADRAAMVGDSTRQVMDALEVCVERLTDCERELLRMRFEPKATNRSVALATGRSEMSISRMLSRLYGSLLDCVQSADVSEQSGGRP